jgi:hypothetical protein
VQRARLILALIISSGAARSRLLLLHFRSHAINSRALHICECEAAAAAVGAILRLSVLQTHLLQSGGQPKDLRQ